MTTADEAARRTPWSARLDFDTLAPAVAKAMGALDHAATRQADQAGLDPSLRELVRLRASQLNGCAYCVDMHVKDALAAGETGQRLHALALWREAPFFSDDERAALGLAEAVTRCPDGHVPEAAWDGAASRFTPAQLAALVGLLVTINGWNRIGAATRTWVPGSYTP